ncbi:MAG: pyruvate kinase [Planctomycetes bacterium]|nr:pyruvate kinase [Planctomycetota bacterium]
MLEKTLARTKIIATLGPSSASEDRIKRMILAGVDAFRLNMSHGDNETHATWVSMVKKVRKELRRPVAIFVDLRGPRIRLGDLPEARNLSVGETIEIVNAKRSTHSGALAIDYPRLLKDVHVGHRILIRDGRAEVEVKAIEGGALICRVKRGTTLVAHQGVNLPDSAVSAPPLSAKDKADIDFAVEHNADWIALSFVRSAKDVDTLQRALKRRGSNMPVCAKIEHPSAIDNLDEIIEATDAVMVARGDLAVEVGHAKVPMLQARIAQACLTKATPVIIATQMLESMINTPQPTRAEVSDVANAVMDAVDAVMLSGETAVGEYPVQTCQVMHDIIDQTEEEMFKAHWRLRPNVERRSRDQAGVGMAVANSAVFTAHLSDAKLILAFTESGRTARLVASFRANRPLICLTARENAFHRMALFWGVLPGLICEPRTVLELHRLAADALVEHRWLRDKDLLVSLAGTFSVAGGTNTMRVIRLEDLRSSV